MKVIKLKVGIARKNFSRTILFLMIIILKIKIKVGEMDEAVCRINDYTVVSHKM